MRAKKLHITVLMVSVYIDILYLNTSAGLHLKRSVLYFHSADIKYCVIWRCPHKNLPFKWIFPAFLVMTNYPHEKWKYLMYFEVTWVCLLLNDCAPPSGAAAILNAFSTHTSSSQSRHQHGWQRWVMFCVLKHTHTQRVNVHTDSPMLGNMEALMLSQTLIVSPSWQHVSQTSVQIWNRQEKEKKNVKNTDFCLCVWTGIKC